MQLDVTCGGVCQSTRLKKADRLAIYLPILNLPPHINLAGTRQWRRGADLESSVANFVESEQLVVIDGGAVQSSFVQVHVGPRGWAGHATRCLSGAYACVLHMAPAPPLRVQRSRVLSLICLRALFIAPRAGAWLHPTVVEPNAVPEVQDPHPHCAALPQ